MKVFNAFMKVMKKHFLTALIFIIVFLFISMQLANNGGEQMSFEESRLDIVVFDEDGTARSEALRDYISDKHKLVELERDDDVILDALYYEEADAVIVIKKGFAESLAAGRTAELFESYHVHDSYADVFVKNMLNEYVSTVKAYMVAGSDTDSAQTKTREALSKETEVKMLSDDNGSEEYTEWFSHYFQYLAYILLAVMISSLGPVLIVMERREIKERTACSGISPMSRVLQIYLGAGVFVLAVWLVFMVAGAVFIGKMYEGRALLAVLNSFVFTLFSAGTAIFVASLGLKDQAMSLVTQIISLGMSFLCGVFVPQSLLGDGVLKFAHILPAYWYVRANNVLVGTEVAYSASEVYKCIGIEMIFVVVMFAAAIISARRRRR